MPPFRVRNSHLIDTLSELAASRNVTSAQLALAWILSQDNQYVPILSTVNANRLLENIAVASIQI
ncbi:MAG: hypothetical protein EOO02_07660 [Chitinophagaceae bacterium]|nr:MAG: hypothetical protein EOO02_07660 [Chitinophagaceae bacterium]